MARPKKEPSEIKKTVGVAFSKAHLEAIEEASTRLEYPKQEIIRLTSQVGLTAIESMKREEFIQWIAKRVK